MKRSDGIKKPRPWDILKKKVDRLLTDGNKTNSEVIDDMDISKDFDAEEQYQMGRKWIHKDDEKAFHLFSQAAERNHPLAQTLLAACYYNGTGVVRDFSESMIWFQKAAEQGNSAAQCSLGLLYYVGKGTQQNYTKAVDLFQKAAAQGEAMAQQSLAECYYYGRGVVKD